MTNPPAFLDSDLAAIMSAGDFDEPFIFTASGGKAIRLRGHFHAPINEQNPGEVRNPVLAQSYSITFREGDLSKRPQRDDQVQARGRNWRVWRVLSDGQGLLTVGLQKVANETAAHHHP